MTHGIAWLAPLLLLLVAFPASADVPDYRIGVDDVLAVSVWDNKDVDQVVFVRPDGKISLPLVGEVPAGGLTVAELTTALDELYGRTIRGAKVSVAVREIRSRNIFFVGGVGKPGPLALTRDLTLLQALSLAGGLVPAADLESAFVLRRGTVIPVDFTRLLRADDISRNVALEPGDTVVVPIARQVYVQGEVKNPGPVAVTRDLTLFQALARVGGPTPLASPRISILRGEGARKETLTLDVGETMSRSADIPLKPYDVVIVPHGNAEVVYVQGEIKTPGALKFARNLTVLQAIAQAGGFTPLAAARRVNLLRSRGAKTESVVINVSELMKGPESESDVTLQPNDIIVVPQRLF